MDRFDELVGTIQEKETSGLWKRCICAQCPSFNACAAEAKELLYCLYGRSFRCITEDFGCICPACPVVDEIGLVNLTFCLLGSEGAQRYTKTLAERKIPDRSDLVG